jgi:2-methylcitrate synthase
MSETTPYTFKPKKSVALSGVPAGNTALCTVGRNGNDLHYRGYDILDLAANCEFEEVAHLLLYGHLPTTAELAHYKRRLISLRGLPQPVKVALEQVPRTAHPMDVLRVGVSMLATVEPEPEPHTNHSALYIADRLLASLGSILLYWYHYSHNGHRIDVEPGAAASGEDDSIGAHILHRPNGSRRCTSR